jgi:hypothetical protein
MKRIGWKMQKRMQITKLDVETCKRDEDYWVRNSPKFSKLLFFLRNGLTLILSLFPYVDVEAIDHFF